MTESVSNPLQRALQSAVRGVQLRINAAFETIAGSREPSPAIHEEAERLGREFARLLGGHADPARMRKLAVRVHTDAFWQAVESFSDNVAGRDWAEVSRHLLDLPEVRAETARLRHPAAWRRALAARHLGLLHATAARDDLRRVMARGPRLVTLTAALALARMHDLGALDWLLEHPYLTATFGRYQLIALIQRFGPDARASVREAVEGWEVASPIHVAAIEALGAWRDTGATKVLRRILAGGSLEARVAAARALGRIGGYQANESLIAALDDYSWQVRAQAARSLGRVGAPEAVARLAARLGDSAWWVRRNAAYALAEAGETGHVALETVVASSSDPFAVEMAEEVLQMLEWERERPGGFHRVA
jgi:HEAT repeat protein